MFKNKTKNEFNALNSPKDKKNIIKVLDQTGKIKDYNRDKGRKALLPGHRISKSGKEYWETRKNRSDQANKDL